MLTVFVNDRGEVLFTYLGVDLHQGDTVKHNDRMYVVEKRTFDVQSGFYEVRLRETEP